MRQELPYSDCYAVISAGFTYNYFKLSVNVRNPDHKNCFRDDYELVCQFWFDKEYTKPCGDGELGLETNSILPLHKVQRAASALTSYNKKLQKLNEKHGVAAADNMIGKIWRTLAAAGVTEVRVYTETSGPFPGWDNVAPIKITKKGSMGFLEVIEKLEILEKKCWEAVKK